MRGEMSPKHLKDPVAFYSALKTTVTWMTENLHRNILHNIFIFALLHEVQAILCNKSSTPLLPFAHTLQMLVLQQNSWLHYFLFFFEYDWIFLEKQ